MFVHRFGQMRINIKISFLLMIGNHKHIPLIATNDIEALVSIEEHLFLPFFVLKFIFQMDKHDLHHNLLHFNDWAPQIHSSHWDIHALVPQEILLIRPF